jgi:esterase
MELSYRLWGPKKTENSSSIEPSLSFLFLHGMGGTGALWRPLAATLEDHHWVLAPDQRGHGGSRDVHSLEKNDFQPKNYGQDLAELLKKLRWEKVWVIGHSMGVRSAVALAYLAPERVAGLILVDLGFSGPAGGGLGQPLAHFLEKMPMRFDSREAARSYFQSHCPDSSIAQYLMAVSVTTPKAQGEGLTEITFPFDRNALLQTLQAAENSSIRDWLPEVMAHGIPVLALRGETSRVWSESDFEKEKATFSGSPLIQFETFLGTGHGLPFEKRAAFIERILQFAQGHSSRRD